MRVYKDYYDILGVSPLAPARAIEEAYWELAHLFHARRSRAAMKRRKMLNEAYEVLANPNRRRTYDRQWNRANGLVERPPEPGLWARLGGWLFARGRSEA